MKMFFVLKVMLCKCWNKTIPRTRTNRIRLLLTLAASPPLRMGTLHPAQALQGRTSGSLLAEIPEFILMLILLLSQQAKLWQSRAPDPDRSRGLEPFPSASNSHRPLPTLPVGLGPRGDPEHLLPLPPTKRPLLPQTPQPPARSLGPRGDPALLRPPHPPHANKTHLRWY